MSEGVERVREWCEAADLPWRDDDGALQVRLDADDVTEVRIELDGEDGPLRLHDRVRLVAGELAADRLAEVVEDVVLSRSSLVDARATTEGEAEVVLVVHRDGLSRHTFLQGIYEVQKVRLLLHREVAAAVAAERTVATLAALADQAWAAEAVSA
jgi:hypothetical protein